MSLTYNDYLQIDDLLNLQQARSEPPEHDETLFIVIHQVYELWFKQLLHEVEKIKRDFVKPDLYGLIHTFKRCRTIMKTLVAQLDILETMTPLSFASFRDRLETASGFQSLQYRELEFALGYKRAETIEYHPAGSRAREVLTRRLHEPAVPYYFHTFLKLLGGAIGDDILERDLALTSPTPGTVAVQDVILEFYKSKPEVVILFELMADFDEGLQEWRYRHVKLVERTIGHKTGTGGSPGVAFLKESLFVPTFPDLWAMRHRL